MGKAGDFRPLPDNWRVFTPKLKLSDRIASTRLFLCLQFTNCECFRGKVRSLQGLFPRVCPLSRGRPFCPIALSQGRAAATLAVLIPRQFLCRSMPSSAAVACASFSEFRFPTFSKRLEECVHRQYGYCGMDLPFF